MKQFVEHTLIVPSKVLAMTVVLSASEANPVMLLPSFFLPAWNRLATSGGQGPISNVFRLIPDCRFHICRLPVEELARPKFPHAVTQTDYKTMNRCI